MCILHPLPGSDDLPEVQCSECKVVFSVVWQRNAWFERVEYCPFCGDEVEERDNAEKE